MSPLKRRQAAFTKAFAKRLWEGLAGRKLKWLADETGISSSLLSDYGKGDKVPGADKAVLIADALSVDPTWLLTGRGLANQLAAPADRRLRDVVKPDLSGQLARQMMGSRPALQNDMAPSIDDDLVEIAEIDLRYGMGGTFVQRDEDVEIEHRRFSRAWLQRVTDSPPTLLFWARGQGNSMSPTIEDGEIVLIDRSQTKPLMDDLIFACALGEIGMIKRLRPRADHVKLLADNSAVGDEIAGPDDHLQIIGRVVAVVKKL